MREPELYLNRTKQKHIAPVDSYVLFLFTNTSSLLNKHFVATASHRSFSYDNRKPWNVKYQFSQTSFQTLLHGRKSTKLKLITLEDLIHKLGCF